MEDEKKIIESIIAEYPKLDPFLASLCIQKKCVTDDKASEE